MWGAVSDVGTVSGVGDCVWCGGLCLVWGAMSGGVCLVLCPVGSVAMERKACWRLCTADLAEVLA